MTRIDSILVALLSVFLFFIPWQTAFIIQQPAVGTTGTLSITLADILLVFMGVLVCIREWRLCMRQGMRIRMMRFGIYIRKPLLMLGLALCAYAFLSIVWSDNRFIAFAGALRLAQALFVCALLIQYRMHRSLFAVCIVAAAVLQSLFGFLQFSMQQSPASSWLGLAYHAAHQLGDAVVEVGKHGGFARMGACPIRMFWLRFYHSDFFHASISCVSFGRNSMCGFCSEHGARWLAGSFLPFHEKSGLERLLDCALSH